jgi:hypothetical protein
MHSSWCIEYGDEERRAEEEVEETLCMCIQEKAQCNEHDFKTLLIELPIWYTIMAAYCEHCND